jgi:hypothetical protein
MRHVLTNAQARAIRRMRTSRSTSQGENHSSVSGRPARHADDYGCALLAGDDPPGAVAALTEERRSALRPTLTAVLIQTNSRMPTSRKGLPQTIGATRSRRTTGRRRRLRAHATWSECPVAIKVMADLEDDPEESPFTGKCVLPVG